MIFQERTIHNGYSYDVEDIFGTLHIESSVKLTGEILDDMVVLLLRRNISAETVTGEIKHQGGTVTYIFKRAPAWEDDKPCDDTHTSTKQPERESIRTRLLRVPGLIWCRKFAEAFREAWKKGKGSQ